MASRETSQKQMSPVAASSLLAVIAFGYILYRHSDPLRAILIAAGVFAAGFWIIYRGKALVAQKKRENLQTEPASPVGGTATGEQHSVIDPDNPYASPTHSD